MMKRVMGFALQLVSVLAGEEQAASLAKAMLVQ